MSGRKLILGTFADEHAVLDATVALRKAGARIADVWTPYPVHGLDVAMGIEPSRLPTYCFAFGLTGTTLAVAFQLWTTAYDWAVNVGGKPLLSLPAFIPVAFETTILLAGIGVFFAMFMGSGLFPGKASAAPPKPVTQDRFVIGIVDAGVAAGAPDDPRALLVAHGGEVSEWVEAPPAEETGSLTVGRLLILCAVVASAVALVGVEVARNLLAGTKERRNWVALPNMVESVPYDAFDENPNFPDGLTLRAPVPGTVARGYMPVPKRDPELANPAPDTPASLERGKRIYGIYCAVCHGATGKGDGIVVAHGGVLPPDLSKSEVVQKKPDRVLFNLISIGRGNMAGYAPQIEREDRWKVVRYIKTLKEGP